MASTATQRKMKSAADNNPCPVDTSDWKIQPVPIFLDEYEVVLPDGTKHHPHEGEMVWVAPWAITMAASVDTMAFKIGFETGNQELVDRGLTGIFAVLEDAIVAWTVTDNRRVQLPQPMDDPEVFRSLTPDFTWFLFNSIKGDESSGEGLPG